MTKKAEQNVLKFIDENNLINKNDKILIALSGGADSVFLLHFLNKFKKRLEIKIGAFHLNHMLRRVDSKKDEEFCKKLCKKSGLDFFSVSKKVKLFSKRNKISIEEAGRIVRYKELQSTAKKEGFNKIATAHNASDNSETVLLNIIKGTGIKGFSGIPIQRENIIRPILILSADQIRNYLKKVKIEYRIDMSNLGNDYERNFLRNEIIPGIKKRLNPKFDDALFKASINIRNIDNYISKIFTEKFAKAARYKFNKLEINLLELKDLDENLFGEFYKQLVQKYFTIDITHAKLISLISLTKKQTGRKVSIGAGIHITKERDKLVFQRGIKSQQLPSSIKVKVGEVKNLDGMKIEILKVEMKEVVKSTGRKNEYISGDKLTDSFILRYWKNGDRFQPLGMKGSKKLSDFLNEQKIPSHLKKEQMVLTNSGQIVWVVGYRVDNRFKVKNKTKKVYQLCLK
jgi:tRNA(Ile)-lysidine synthase